MVDETLQTTTLEIASLADTQRLGLQIGQLLIPGDKLLLTGDLGAGKTTLTQSIAKGLDVPKEYYVTSPSFALMQEYPGRCPLYHFDCYRLSGEDDIEGAGLSEYLTTARGVCVIEWAARLGSLTPDNALTIKIILLEGEKRRFVFETCDAVWTRRMETIAEAFDCRYR